MKRLLNFFKKGTESKRKLVDFHQESIQEVGKDQIRRLVEKGLSLPIVVL